MKTKNITSNKPIVGNDGTITRLIEHWLEQAESMGNIDIIDMLHKAEATSTSEIAEVYSDAAEKHRLKATILETIATLMGVVEMSSRCPHCGWDLTRE